MTEQNGGTALMTRADQTASDVSPFGGDSAAFGTALKIAKALSESTIVPKDFVGNPANCMVAMEYAFRLGASVLAVMQNLDVIHGRPSLRASFLIGTVNASGRFSPIRYEWESEQGSDEWGCRAVATDRESGEKCRGPLITIGLAKDEGWVNKSGSKWKTIPELMLMYRAGAWWTRVYAPDLSLGLHTSDEYEDMGPPPSERRTLVAQALDAPDAASIPKPPAAGAGTDPEEGEGDDLKPIRDELYEMMGTTAPHLFNDQEARRKWTNRQVGKATAKGCSEYELRQLIAAIQKGDTDPETPAEEGTPATSTPFDDENELPA